MEARNIRITHNGAALGEIISEGVILNDQNEELAAYRQRIRAWMSRPMLDLRIEIEPKVAPTGYPWHAYYRRALRGATIARQSCAASTAHRTKPRIRGPVTPDYLDIHLGKFGTFLFPGGLPFHQRHGTRMVDVILVPEGEACRTFDLGLGSIAITQCRPPSGSSRRSRLCRPARGRRTSDQAAGSFTSTHPIC